MKLLRIWAVTRKEFIHVLRDPRSLGMGIAMPMVLLFLFGYALTLDVDEVPLVVWDQSGTHTGREFISRFDGSPYFSLLRYVRSYEELELAIDRGEALIALVIPADFARNLQSGRAATVQAILDGSGANTATIALGYAEAVSRSYSLNVSLDQLRRTGGRTPRTPLEVRPRVWFNTDMESKNYIIPGLIAVIMMVIAALLTSLTIAREWETGTMEQLISTPLKGTELILGKLVPYFGIGMFDVLLAVIMGEFVFDVPFRGSLALMFGMAAVFLTGALSLGLMISIITKSQLLASQAAVILTFLPAMLLSGFIYYINNMPPAIQIVTYLVPARYFVSLMKGIYLKGVGLEVMAQEAVLLAIFAAGVFTMANIKFKKRIV